MLLEESLFQESGTSGVQMKALSELKGLQMGLRGWNRPPGPQKIHYFQEWSSHSTLECLKEKKKTEITAIRKIHVFNIMR